MKPKLKSFHVTRPRASNECCRVRVSVLQENHAAIVSRGCADNVVMTIRTDDQSWGSNYCELHGRVRLEELQRQIMEPEEEEKVEDKRTA